jgi:hypothetical protein
MRIVAHEHQKEERERDVWGAQTLTAFPLHASVKAAEKAEREARFPSADEYVLDETSAFLHTEPADTDGQ